MWRDGEAEEQRTDVRDVWRDDLVAFLIGCSFTFERAMVAEGSRSATPSRASTCRCSGPRASAGRPGRSPGPLVVSMRPMTPEQAIRATQVTARYPAVHGAPVHVGEPEALGIDDVAAPDYGDPVEVRDGEVPVFWACGVTPQAVAAASRPELMITHAPGHMFVTDVPDARWAA